MLSMSKDAKERAAARKERVEKAEAKKELGMPQTVVLQKWIDSVKTNLVSYREQCFQGGRL